MWQLEFEGLPPDFQLMEDEDFLSLIYRGKEVACFFHSARPEEIRKAAAEYLQQGESTIS